MPPSAPARPTLAGLVRPRRWIVLAAAVLLGYAAAGGFAGRAPALFLPDLPAAVAGRLVATAHAQPAVPPAPAAPAAAATDTDPPEEPDAAKGKRPSATVGVTIDAGDREYDSFEALVQQAPWIAGVVFVTIFLVFTTPLLIIALVIWYKVRRNRMLNETLVALAEKGVVPPADAVGAIAAGRPAAALRGGAASAPLYEQARAIRKQAVWSDLRKGIIVGAVGLGFTFYSMLDDGSPNFVGLILLFVGLGYIVLWYFEDRHVERAGGPPPGPPPA